MKKRIKKDGVIVRGIKYRFYPTEEQKTYINGMFGSRRFFWNKILEKYLSLYEENKKIKKYNETSEEKKDLIPYNLLCGSNGNSKIYNIDSIIEDGLNNLDDDGQPLPKDYSWLRNYPCSVYESTLVDLGIAWDRYFKYLDCIKRGEIVSIKVGKPKKKKKGEVNSIKLRNTSTLVDGKNIINWKSGLIKTPGFNKLGYCKCVLHKRFRGQVKYTTISKDIDDSYYISLTVEENGSYPEVNTDVSSNTIVGIDFGLKTFATMSNADSDGYIEKINLSAYEKIKKLEEEINELKRQSTKCSVTLSRQGSDPYTISVKEMNKREQENKYAFKGWHKEYSNGYKKYVGKINKKQAKINHIKSNCIGEFANDIVKNENVNAISVETLGIRDMTIRDKTKKKEGKRLSKKAKFRRSMARKFNNFAIGKAIQQIEYDCKKEGKHFIKADRKFASTKICSSCGYKLPSIDLGTRKWTCPNCGKEHDRDVNAAINLAKYGLEHIIGKQKCKEEELIAAEVAAN